MADKEDPQCPKNRLWSGQKNVLPRRKLAQQGVVSELKIVR
jgi:hypothetical protein